MATEAPALQLAVAPQPAPWESAPAHEQLFVLITGANSGIGLAIGQRLIDEFLATRSLSSHLILLPTTRSTSKSLLTSQTWRAHAERAARTSNALRLRAGEGFRWQDAVARIHVLGLLLDLCDLRGIHAFANGLCRGTVSSPEGLEGEYLRNVRIPRLDTVVFNAAYGGWSGCDYPKAVWEILTKGIVQMVTWTNFKKALPASREAPLGEVFCACFFGHYVLAHQLLPLLSRRSRNGALGRIVWSGSLEALRDVFTLEDMQSFTKPVAYESAKRLTDIMMLTYSLPSVRPFSARFLQKDNESSGDAADTPVPPKLYVTHPGIIVSTLFPVPWFLMWAYELSLVLARWLGSPWHSVSAYRGATSSAWVVLEDQDVLDELGADSIKWGSSCNRKLETNVKKTEVEGWGWEGKPETDETIAADPAKGILHKSVGRKLGSNNVTEEDIVEFEVLGAKCWEEMERMRHQWANILAQET